METICSVCGKIKKKDGGYQNLLEFLAEKKLQPSEKVKELVERSKKETRSFKEMQDDCGNLAGCLSEEFGIDPSHSLCPVCHKRVYSPKKASLILKKISKYLSS